MRSTPGALLSLALGLSLAAMRPASIDYDLQEKILALSSGQTLRYTLALPSPLSAQGSYPLIVALHYGGRVTPYYGRSYLENLVLPALRELGAIMVAPDCPGAGWIDPRSEEAILALVDRIQKDFPVDSQRLLITGYSLGAMGTWDLVFKHPHTFSAAIPMSGLPPQGMLIAKTETALRVIHSRNDEHFAFGAVKKVVQTCRDQGLNVQLQAVFGPGHYEYDQFRAALREAVPWLKSLWKQ